MSKRHVVFTVAGAVVVIVAVLCWLLVSGRMFLWTEHVELGKPEQTSDGGIVWSTSRFVGAVTEPTDPGQGTATVGLAFGNFGEPQNLQLMFQLWHPEATQVRDLRLVLDTPQGWGSPLFQFPDGNGWGSITHRANGGELVLKFDRMGWGDDGYVGTIMLYFTTWANMEWIQEYPGTIRAEADFDMNGTGWRRFIRWHVHGTWEMPVDAKTLGGAAASVVTP